MYILKNALVSIRRNKGRNILIGIIVLIIACASAITLSIRNAASTLVASYDSKYDITGSIGVNRENLMQDFKPGEDDMESRKDIFASIPSLTVADIDNYGKSDYVKSYYYTYNLSMNASNITKATSETSTTGGMQFGQREGNTTINRGDFTIEGYSSYDAMVDFINGKYTISQGEVSNDFTSSNCVISDELATINGLKVNDKITLVDPNNTTSTYELTITGIYKENDSSESSTSTDTRMNMFSNSANTIITNSKTVENMLTNDSTLKANLNPTFILTSKDVIDKYKAELTTKGLNENYTLTTNLDTIESGTQTIKNVSTFAMTFLIIVLVIGSIVLFVINMINVRERKYEIGVLRTIGMKKSLVITQFATELLIISVVGLIIGCGIGSLISVPTANHLLQQEVTQAKEEKTSIGNNFGRQGGFNMGNFRMGVANIDYVSTINAVVDYKVLMQLLGIGLLLTIFSSMAATIAISRFSPLAILRERS